MYSGMRALWFTQFTMNGSQFIACLLKFWHAYSLMSGFRYIRDRHSPWRNLSGPFRFMTTGSCVPYYSYAGGGEK